MTNSLQLLLIDGHDDIAFLMRKSLERASHQVTVCRTGTEGLGVLKHRPIDLILLDHKLADMDGLELLHTLPQAGIVAPAFIVTGQGDERLAIQVLRAGALDYIKKDEALTFLAELPKRVEEALALYRLEQNNRLLERQLYQAQKMQSVGTLAGGVAHEFNNLLAGIQGYATLGLREPLVNATIKEFLQNIVNLSERAANLTRQLLTFARRPALVPQPTSMQKMLLATVDLLKDSLKIATKVSIDLPDEQNDSLLVLADANQLQQVLVNLALNARDAMTTPQPVEFRLGRRLLTGKLTAYPEDVPTGDYVLLEAEDHGSGMSEEVLRQALDPFFTTKEIGQGTGLGLSVASGIIHGHNGFLTISTDVNHGTCMRIYLPRLQD
jgi:signal transduction histidine kinase